MLKQGSGLINGIGIVAGAATALVVILWAHSRKLATSQHRNKLSQDLQSLLLYSLLWFFAPSAVTAFRVYRRVPNDLEI